MYLSAAEASVKLAVRKKHRKFEISIARMTRCVYIQSAHRNGESVAIVLEASGCALISWGGSFPGTT
jgi:hypothetical protein